MGNRLPGLSIDPQLECERGNQVVLGSSSGNLNLPPGTGRAGESAARSHVTNQLGYEIVGTNYRTREGEIDIVARAGAWLVLFEVKTRTNRAFGSGVEQISVQKSLRLQAVAQSYLAKNDLENSDWRTDSRV